MTNGAAVYLLYRSFPDAALLNNLLEQGSQNRALWLGFSLRAIIPVVGILLELLGSRFAKWLNIGYFLFAGIVLSAAGIFALPDHHAWVALFTGLPSLAVAGLNWLLYRHPNPASAVRGMDRTAS